MRTISLLAFPCLALAAGCSDSSMPNGQVFFTPGQETSALGDVASYKIEKLDRNGNSTSLYEGPTLPTTIDMGSSGYYRFRATGFDAAGNVVARGESLPQEVSTLGGGDVPIFVVRTDRTSLAADHFTIAPGASPKVVVIGSSNLWLWTNNVSPDHITTDGYDFAYWQRVAPKGTVDYSSINCPVVPCEWSTLVIVGGYFALAIGNDWAIAVDEYDGLSWDYPPLADLGSFADVAGGRVLPGANGSAFLIGAARNTTPTAYNVLFDKQLNGYVKMLAAARVGAATVFESGMGLVVVGGSSAGPGVERIEPGGAAFVALDYPADPVAGAALVVEDPTHVLRVGGLNPDATPAETVRIDLSCSAGTCAAEQLVGQALPILGAQSFYDNETGDSLVVGEEPETGLTKIYHYYAALGAFLPVEVPANQQRVHPAAIELPNRLVALVGGTSPGDPQSSRSTLSVVSF